MKKILVFIIGIGPFFCEGQNTRCGLPNTTEIGSYDLQHYIPPQYARSGLGVGGDIDTGFLVLSTASLVPINVTIKNAVAYKTPTSSNTLNQTVTISNALPVVINLSKAPYGTSGYGTRNITNGNSPGLIDSTQGLILQSSQPFYAVVRHKSGSQGNYLISKGRLAMGKRFRSGHIYNNTNVSNVKSEHISIMATQDNTTVTIADLPSGMFFVNSPSFPITLNQYESYTLAGLQDASTNNTLVNQLNGALITSNKNITVVTGSFLGGGEGSGRDIGIDQIIPINYLGKNYFLVRGDGSINMEVPMVVADFDTTQIYLNGSATPIATINSGQHYMVYNQWGADTAMIINTSKPAYVFQSNGANASNGNGFMILAPLNLAIENQKLVIPQPNQIGSGNLYIVTNAGAILTVNNVVVTGGKPFISNPNFIYYKLATGNATTYVECTAPYFCTNTILSGARGAACSYTGFPNSFANRDDIQVEIGKTDTSNYLANDLIELFEFKFDTICMYPKKGSIQNLGNGKVAYTPFANSNGCDTLIYSIRDSINGLYDQNMVIYCLKLKLTIDSFENIICSGQKKGYIKVKAQGGNPSYFYSIKTKKSFGSPDTFQASTIFSGLKADTFIFKVIDALGNTDTIHKIIKVTSDTTKQDSFRTICKNQSITFNGLSLNISGIYKDTLVNAKGCDSFLYLHLTVNDTTRKDSFRTICKNQSIIFNGQNLNISGTYKDTLLNKMGCDSFFYLHLTVNDTSQKDSFLTICKIQPIVFNGQNLTLSGNYKDTLVNINGCDSFLYLHLTLLDTTRKDSFKTICKNQPVTFNGQSLNLTATYKDTLINSVGCDSFLYLHLNVLDTSSFLITKSICFGDSFFFNQFQRKTSGLYKDSLINSSSCDSFIYLNLTVNPLPIANAGIDQTRALCDGDSVLLGTAFNPNYSYTWSPSIGLNSAVVAQPWCKTNQARAYYLTVTNIASGCKSIDSSMISVKPDDLTLDYKSRLHLKCTNDFTGEIVIKAKNGNSGYKYSLSPTNFNTNGIFKNLSAGFYQFTIQDSRSCLYSDTLYLTQPSKIKIDKIIKNDPRCYKGQDGEIQLSISGGVGQYRINWSPTNDTGTIIKNLDSGIYFVNILDTNSCLLIDSFKLTHPFPIAIVDTIIKLNPCYGDSLASIEVKVNGGTGGYLYKWSNSKSTPMISNLVQGSYHLTVSDAVQCNDSFVFFVVDSPLLVFDTISPTTIHCDGIGSIYIKAKGGNPFYTYSVDSGLSYSVNNRFRISQAKTYHIRSKDKNNCIAKKSIPVYDKERLEVLVYPKDTLVNIGDPVQLEFRYLKGDSSKVQSIRWKPTEGLSCSDCRSPVTTAFVPTLYYLEIKYDSLCLTSSSAKISHKLDELYIPNSFAPNSPNPENKTFKIFSNRILRAKLRVFNRIGEKVFETDQGHKIGWDGTYKGDLLNEGVFIYWVEVIYLDGRKVNKSGAVSLFR